MKIIAFDNDTKGMAIRFLSQELRLMKPGCNILVSAVQNVKIESLCKVDFLFLTQALACEVAALGGKLYTLKSINGPMKDYHAEVMTLLPEILA